MDAMSLADLQKLQGRWVQIRFEENGIVDPPDSHSTPGAVLTIEGCNFYVGVPGHRTILEGAFTLDARLLPKAITWVDAIGDDAGKPLPSIYDLSDGRFMFVAADEHMPRPTDFVGGAGLTLRSFVRAIRCKKMVRPQAAVFRLRQPSRDSV